jgi:hypothetical protein
MASYKKILKYWTVDQDNPQFRANLKAMDVTNYHCEEDLESLQVIDGSGRVVAEFGPGKQYEGWMLTVEYPTVRQQLSALSLSILKKLDAPRPAQVVQPVVPVNAAPIPVAASTTETGFVLGSRAARR